MSEDGSGICLTDRVRGERWTLDDRTRHVSSEAARYAQEHWAAPQVGRDGSPVFAVTRGRAEQCGDNSVLTTFETPAGRLAMRWVMHPDRVVVTVDPAECAGVSSFTLPGAFRPDGGSFLSAVPNCQGILHTGKGPEFYRPRWGQGVDGFTLDMFGQISSRGALVAIAETELDATLHWEKALDGDVRVMWRQERSMGEVSYRREVVLMAADPDLTAVCKAYRRYEIEKGRFRTWDQKIEQRPVAEYLFGACLVFLGYWNDPDTDYAAGLRSLKASGIDKALVYPLYHNTTQDCSGAIDGAWIDQRGIVPICDELGYLPGGFIYITDGPEGDGENRWRDLRLNESGKPHLYWEMNGLKWYSLSYEERFKWAKRFLDGEMRDLAWVHYDVLTCPPFFEDYSPAHRGDARSDAEWRLRILDYTAGKGWIVSSEGFWGRAASHYDLGNTKLTNPVGRDEYAVVPMTMLVYHDSAFHTWWEVDNYNNPEHRSQYERGYQDRYPFIPGQPRVQSAMDALMGTPPDIFPFGRQWNLVPHSRDLYFYNRGLQDSLVQESIERAKSVMALNSRIGRLEMTGHTLHTSDGALQETRFADGTRVIANFANVPLEAPDAGTLQPESWTSITEDQI